MNLQVLLHKAWFLFNLTSGCACSRLYFTPMGMPCWTKHRGHRKPRSVDKAGQWTRRSDLVRGAAADSVLVSRWEGFCQAEHVPENSL
jgi:hypothetical protein